MKNIYQYITFPIIAVFFSLNVYAQYVEPHQSCIVLDASITGEREFVARDSIIMLDGFEYTATAYDSSFSLVARIDPYLVFPPDDNTTGGPGDGDHGQVGRLQSSFNVLSSGAANYKVGFVLPDGINNSKPDIGLNYTSGAGWGELGYGFSIYGISRITRVPRSKYYNDSIKAISFSGNDQLSLDGNYLIFDENEGRYHTEVESFEKITRVGSSFDDGFRVIKKDGRIFEYGIDTSTRHYLQNNDYPIAWYLSKITDPNGNYIEYEYVYDRDEGTFNIKYIRYSGNEALGIEPVYELEFNYWTYNFYPPSFFSAGANNAKYFLSTDKFLHYIEVNYIPEQKLIYKYCFGMEVDPLFGDWQLKSFYLGETDNPSKEEVPPIFNRTRFEWGNQAYNPKTISDSVFIGNQVNYEHLVQIIKIDFGNDNTDDIITWSIAGNSVTNNRFNAYLNLTTGADDLNLTRQNQSLIEFTGREILKISAGDFNGDGLEELFMVYKFGGNLIGQIYNTNGYQIIPGKVYFNVNISSYDYPEFFIGDYTGDGIIDVMCISREGSKGNVRIWESSVGEDEVNLITTCNGMLLIPSKTLSGDFDGDGKLDILCQNFGDKESKIISLNSDNTVINFINTKNVFSNSDYQSKFGAGDFNGDGKTDVVIFKNKSNYNWDFYYSAGNGIFSDSISIQSINVVNHRDIVVTDLNHDGFADVMLIKRNDYSDDSKEEVKPGIEYTRRDFLINPNNKELGIEVREIALQNNLIAEVAGSDGGSYLTDDFQFAFANINGKNPNQLISGHNSPGLGQDMSIYCHLSVSGELNQFRNKNVVKITDEYGVEKEVFYSPLNLKNPNLASNSFSFPVTHYKGTNRVVYEVKENGFNNISYSTVYDYDGPLIHRSGKGFLGYELVTKYDMNNKTKTIDYYSIGDHNNMEHTNSFVSQYDDQTKFVKKSSYDFDYLDSGDLSYYPYIKTTSSESFDVHGVSKSTIVDEIQSIDSYGNPTVIKKSYGNGGAYDISETQKIRYINIDNGNRYNIGLADSIKTIYHKNGQSDIVKQKLINYYPDKPLVESIVFEPGNPLSYTESYVYDDFGNIATSKTLANGLDARIESQIFDPNGRYTISKTNNKNQTSNFQYYESTGWLKSVTDPNGFTTTYEYDRIGNVKKETLPNGMLRMNALQWVQDYQSNPLAPDSALYYSWTQTSGQPFEMTYFDKFGNELRKVTPGLDTLVFVDKVYSNSYGTRGLLRKQSLPYKADEAAYYYVFNYNKIRELELKTHPNGSIDSYSYNVNEITVNKADGQSSTKTYNEANWLVNIIDNNTATIDYTYYSNGLAKSMTVNGNDATRIYQAFDIFDRLDTIIDPDMGRRTFQYNAFGEKVFETDAMDRLFNFTYDKLGRIETRTNIDGTTTWIYDTKPYGIGQVSEINHLVNNQSVSAENRHYFYNDNGLLKKEIQEVDQDPLEFNYTYDPFNRLRMTTYPDGYIIDRSYNGYGFLINIIDEEGENLYQTNGINAFGKVEDFKLGDEIQSKYEYDPIDQQITSISAGKGGSYSNIQNYQYLWSPELNLSSRADLNKNITETFNYDGFNRLDSIYVNGNLQLRSEFDALGNIVLKSDVGVLSYGEDGAPPHALTTIDRNPSTISDFDQKINYTSFKKIAQITEGTFKLNMSYDLNQQRLIQTIKDTVANTYTRKRYFNTLYEQIEQEDGSIKHLHYLAGPSGLFAIFVKDSNGNDTLNYILKDHIGSINYILNKTGNTIEEMNFDAWGNRRNPVNWTYNNVPEDYMFDRGYTLHEHLKEFKLINMNGRVYDPVVARFLSPDPVLQMPEYSQNFNRYSYVLNNPLKYTDPSGFVIQGGGDDDEYEPKADANFPWWLTYLSDLGKNFRTSANEGYSATKEALFGKNEISFASDSKIKHESEEGEMPSLDDFIYINPAYLGEQVAYSIEFSGGAESWMASNATPWGGLYIVEGPDKYEYYNFSSAGIGGGWVGAGLEGSLTAYYYIGDINNLTIDSFKDGAINGNFSVGEVLTVGENYSVSKDGNGGLLIGVSITGGVGVSISPVSGQITWKSTKVWE